MTNKTIIDQIRQLTHSTNRSKAAQFKELYNEIEAAIAAGVKRKDIIELLNKNGLEVTTTSFNTLLSRQRMKNANKQPIKVIQQKMIEKPDEALSNENLVNARQTSTQDIDDIINSTPNLEQLARLAKKKEHK